jgi:hypothetical protein
MPDRNRRLDSTVVALAGRRIDAENTNPARLSLAQVPLVRKGLIELFTAENVAALVCSAACGADLIALEVAGKLKLRRRVILPFAPDRFRETSVVDRPGRWGGDFDRVIADVRAKGDLVVLSPIAGNDGHAFQAANRAIIREAQKLAEPGKPLAVIVWEGAPRSESDTTEAFRVLTQKAGFLQRFVLTVWQK